MTPVLHSASSDPSLEVTTNEITAAFCAMMHDLCRPNRDPEDGERHKQRGLKSCQLTLALSEDMIIDMTVLSPTGDCMLAEEIKVSPAMRFLDNNQIATIVGRNLKEPKAGQPLRVITEISTHEVANSLMISNFVRDNARAEWTESEDTGATCRIASDGDMLKLTVRTFTDKEMLSVRVDYRCCFDDVCELVTRKIKAPNDKFKIIYDCHCVLRTSEICDIFSGMLDECNAARLRPDADASGDSQEATHRDCNLTLEVRKDCSLNIHVCSPGGETMLSKGWSYHCRPTQSELRSYINRNLKNPSERGFRIVRDETVGERRINSNPNNSPRSLRTLLLPSYFREDPSSGPTIRPGGATGGPLTSEANL